MMTNIGRKLCSATACLTLLCAGAQQPCHAQNAADLASKQEQQKQIKADTDRLVRQMETMIRVMQYYQIDKGAEKDLMTEAAGTLSGLSRNQMTEVIARLEEAGRAPAAAGSDQALQKAYERHREIVQSLKALAARRDAIASLDQAVARLEKASQNQLDLHLLTDRALQEINDGSIVLNRQVRPGAKMSSPFLSQADRQDDLRKEVSAIFQQMDALKSSLTPEQQERVARVEEQAATHLVNGKLTEISSKLRLDDSTASSIRWPGYNAAVYSQREVADVLQNLAQGLREPQEKSAALRKALDRLEQNLNNEKRLREQTEAADTRTDTRELAAKQVRINHDNHSVKDLLQPLNPKLADVVDAASMSMEQANKELQKGRPKPAGEAQEQAEKILALAQRQLEQALATPNKEEDKKDPIAALDKASEKIAQLAKQEQALADDAKAIPAKDAAELAPKQEELSKQVREEATELAEANPKVSDELAEAAMAMEAAKRDLQNGKQDLAAQEAKRATTKLEQAAQALSQAADRQKSREIAEQAAAKPNGPQPSQAARQVAKAVEKAEAAAAKAQEAADKMESKKREDGQQKPKDPADADKPDLTALEQKVADRAKDLNVSDAGIGAATSASTSLKKGDLTTALDQERAAFDQLEQAARLEAAAGTVSKREAAKGKMEPAKAEDAGSLAEVQKQVLEATKALAEAKQANAEAQAAVAQAKAQSSPTVQKDLEDAQKQLTEASQQAQQGKASQAKASDSQAAHGLRKILDALNRAAAALGEEQALPGKATIALASPDKPGTPPGKPGDQPPTPTRAVVQGTTPKPNSSGKTGQGVAARDTRQDKPPSIDSLLKQVNGQSGFLGLPPRERELIRQALSEGLSPEYAGMIQQYYLNIAGGKPAVRPNDR